VRDAFDRGADEMPGAGIEGAVEVGDQPLLSKVELDLPEQLRPHEPP